MDGVDLGVYAAVAYTDGNGNYLVLQRCEAEDPQTIPKPQSVGSPVVVDGTVFRSHQEGRVAVLLRALDIPYLDETALEQVSDANGHKYNIDFLIYPDDPERVAYLEVKPFRPIREEILKAVVVVRTTNIPVFLVWGRHFVQGIGMWNDKHRENGFHDVRKYEEGIRATKLHSVGGRVVCDEGYYFMTNNSAVGRRWEECEPAGETTAMPFEQKKLAELLDRGVRRISRKRRDRFHMTGRVRKTTRVRSAASGKTYRPADGFKAYLFRDVLESHANPTLPGASDCFSVETRAAFRAAEDHVFEPSE